MIRRVTTYPGRLDKRQRGSQQSKTEFSQGELIKMALTLDGGDSPPVKLAIKFQVAPSQLSVCGEPAVPNPMNWMEVGNTWGSAKHLENSRQRKVGPYHFRVDPFQSFRSVDLRC